MNDVEEILFWTRSIVLKLIKRKNIDSYEVSDIEYDADNTEGYTINITAKNEDKEMAKVCPTLYYNIDVWISNDKLKMNNNKLRDQRKILQLCDPNLEHQFTEQMKKWIHKN